jgi:CubicO group peptidase (beta-lactamase class C family)
MARLSACLARLHIENPLAQWLIGRGQNRCILGFDAMGTTVVIPFACIALLGLSSPVVACAAEAWVDSKTKNIERFLQERFADGNTGMVIGLLDEQGRRVFGAGKLDNGTDERVDGETVFDIGSVTKVFTVLLVQDAARRGELKLEDPVAKFMPDGVKVPSRGEKEITLLNLAAQDSGLPFFLDNLGDKPAKELTLEEKREGTDAYTVDKLYAGILQFQLTQDPGTRFEYSNVGMALLGNVVERKTGKDFESLVVERICQPLRLENTRMTLSAELKARLAVGHLQDDSRAPLARFRAMAPAGGLRSTANDLLTFLSANLGITPSKELTPMMEAMCAPRHTDSPVFGKTATPWMDERVYNPPGSEFWGHSGGGFGSVAFVAFDRQHRRGVVVLTNQMKVPPNGIGWRLLQGIALTRDNTSVREVIGVGIGLESDDKSGLPRITMVFPESPAGKARLTTGLALRQVNDTSMKGKSLAECVATLGGPIDSKVRLELVDSEQKERTVELTRQKFLTLLDETPLE